jgi:hypothetical protein
MGFIGETSGLRAFFGLKVKEPEIGPNDKMNPVIMPRTKPKPEKEVKWVWKQNPDDEPLRDHVCVDCGKPWFGTVGLDGLKNKAVRCLTCWMKWWRAERSGAAGQGGTGILGYINKKKSILEI